MNKNRIIILLSLFLVFVSSSLFAQTVKYVAYFPVPYLSHTKITADTAFFAGRENGLKYKNPDASEGSTVTVGGTLTSEKISTQKDLELKTSNTHPTAVSFSVADAEGGSGEGTLIVDKKDGVLNINKVGNNTTTSKIKQLKADNDLSVKEIVWEDVTADTTDDDKYSAFVKGSNNYSSTTSSDDGFPIGTTRFCWSPLRIKGTYEYQYYLIAYDGDTCP